MFKYYSISTWRRHKRVLLKKDCKFCLQLYLQKNFRSRKKNIINIISGNFEITMKEIKDLKAEVRDLTGSLEFTENVIEKKVEKLETKLDNLEDKVQDIWDYQIDPDYI